MLEACLATGKEGCRDLIVQADVSGEDQVAEMFGCVIEEFGRIDDCSITPVFRSRLLRERLADVAKSYGIARSAGEARN